MLIEPFKEMLSIQSAGSLLQESIQSIQESIQSSQNIQGIPEYSWVSECPVSRVQNWCIE
jgi:hypothetical protein